MARWLRAGGPVVRRPRFLLVILADAEFKDVRLGEANVFDKLPSGALKSLRNDAALPRRNVCHGTIKRRMRVTPALELHQLRAKCS